MERGTEPRIFKLQNYPITQFPNSPIPQSQNPFQRFLQRRLVAGAERFL